MSTAVRTLDEINVASNPELTEIEVTLSYYWENDGIGPYEYWGAKGFDRGVDYVVIDDYSYDTTGMTPEEITTINSMCEKMFDVWSESIADESADDCDDCEPDDGYDYDERTY